MQDQEFDQEIIRQFFEYHAKNMREDPYYNFWDGSPLCPSYDLDALEAAKQLHRELQEWVKSKGYPPHEVKLLQGEAIKQSGFVMPRCYPVAQIAWQSGPKHWPAGLIQGRSYEGSGTYKHAGKEYYIEPATEFILTFQELR